MDVPPGQPVDLRIRKRLSESYIPSKRSKSAFSGVGMRLGAPVTPVVSSSGSNTSGITAPAQSNARFEVDQTMPMTSVQIRLADGTRSTTSYMLLVSHLTIFFPDSRLVSRMNLTHTVGDIRIFING
jgi:UBX domain-containing protein 1